MELNFWGSTVYKKSVSLAPFRRINKSKKLTRLSALKGQCREIFCFWFFSWISFPQAPEYPIRTVLNFFENSRRYSQIKVCHRYQRHRRQILPPVSLVIPVANLPPVSTTPAVNCRRYQRHRWQFATGIKDTSGKFATGVMTPVANNGNNIRLLRP